jgi:branched-chain amino acid transport system permease protein
MEYILHLLILISFYTLLSQSLNLSAGFTGLISLAQAGFYGIGAYTTAILSTQFGFSFWLNLPLAMLISGAIAFVVSLIALRTVEDYFIICTLGIQVVLFSVMNNWMELTRGPLGIPVFHQFIFLD